MEGISYLHGFLRPRAQAAQLGRASRTPTWPP